MKQGCSIKAPFFEIGPKSYLFGQDVIDLAVAADEASKKYDVDIIFTTPIVEIARVKAATSRIHVFAPHMDPLRPGRGPDEADPCAAQRHGCGKSPPLRGRFRRSAS